MQTKTISQPAPDAEAETSPPAVTSGSAVAASAASKRYRLKEDLQYWPHGQAPVTPKGEKPPRQPIVAAGEIREDLPPSSIPWLLEQGRIELLEQRRIEVTPAGAGPSTDKE